MGTKTKVNSNNETEIALIRRNIRFGRVTYSLHGVCYAATVPFFPVFLSSRGMRPSHIGAVMAAVPLFVLFTPRFVHKVLERYTIDKTTLFCICSFGAAVALMLAALLSEDVDPDWDVFNVTDTRDTSLNVDNAAQALVNKDALEDEASTLSLVSASLLTLLHMFLAAPCNVLLDQRMLGLLPAWTKGSWGQMRVFGAYSLVWAAPLCGHLSNSLGFAVCYLVNLVATVLMLISNGRTAILDEELVELQLKTVVSFLRRRRQRRLALFLTVTVIMGAATSIVNTFLFVFLKKAYEASSVLLGFTVTIACLSEMVVLTSHKKLCNRLSDTSLVQISMIVWALRALAYSFIRNPWIALLLEPLHAVTFAFTWIAGTHYIAVSFPLELSAATTGTMNAAVFGIGPFFGNLLGGLMFDILGPRLFFQTTSAMMTVAVGVYFFLDKKLEAQVAFHTMADDVNDQRDDIQAPSVVGTPLTPAAGYGSHCTSGSTQASDFDRSSAKGILRIFGGSCVRGIEWVRQQITSRRQGGKLCDQVEEGGEGVSVVGAAPPIERSNGGEPSFPDSGSSKVKLQYVEDVPQIQSRKRQLRVAAISTSNNGRSVSPGMSPTVAPTQNLIQLHSKNGAGGRRGRLGTGSNGLESMSLSFADGTVVDIPTNSSFAIAAASGVGVGSKSLSRRATARRTHRLRRGVGSGSHLHGAIGGTKAASSKAVASFGRRQLARSLPLRSPRIGNSGERFSAEDGVNDDDDEDSEDGSSSLGGSFEEEPEANNAALPSTAGGDQNENRPDVSVDRELSLDDRSQTKAATANLHVEVVDDHIANTTLST